MRRRQAVLTAIADVFLDRRIELAARGVIAQVMGGDRVVDERARREQLVVGREIVRPGRVGVDRAVASQYRQRVDDRDLRTRWPGSGTRGVIAHGGERASELLLNRREVLLAGPVRFVRSDRAIRRVWCDRRDLRE